MKVYCYGCGTCEETEWLVRCPRCETMDIGIEEDRGWHIVSKVWAYSKSFAGDKGGLSLPWWFERNPDYLPKWKTFKARLIDVESIQPPVDYTDVSHQDFYNFWMSSSGILSLTVVNVTELIDTPILGNLVHRLATIWADHHWRRQEAGRKAREAEEKARREKVLRKSKPRRRRLENRP